jgi:hypothetical protein
VIDKSFIKVTKRKKEKTQINKIRDESVDMTKIPVKFRRSLGRILKKLIFQKENLDEIGKFANAYHLPKLHQKNMSLK